jgi:DNA polymerase III sliding clamp (beta) subunit (PCNA family)
MTLAIPTPAIIVHSKAFKAIIAELQSIVDTKLVVGINNCVRLQVRDNQLHLTVKSQIIDLERVLSLENVFDEEFPDLFVPLVRFGPFVATLPDEPLEMSIRSRCLYTVCAGIESTTKLFDVNSAWPSDAVPLLEAMNSVLALPLLHAMRTRYATANNNRIFQGLQLEWISDDPSSSYTIVRTVATDRQRLATANFQDDSNGINAKILLHPKSFDPLEKFLKSCVEERISFTIHGSSLYLTSDRSWIRTALLEGTLPEWEGFIPNDCTTRITVERSLLVDAVKRLEFYGEETTNRKQRIDLLYKNSELTVRAATEDGQATQVISVRGEGVDFERSYPTQSLFQALKAATSAEVDISFDASGKLLLIDDNYRALVLGIST